MKKVKKPKRAVPLPEAIDGRRWQIDQSPSARQAGVDPQHARMLVPMGDGETERLVRLHEMTHVRITPVDLEREVHELPHSLVQLCEDARVHGQMRRLGFEIGNLKGLISDMELRQTAEHAHIADLAAAAAAMWGTGELERLREAIPQADVARHAALQLGADMAAHRMHRVAELPEFEVTVQMVKDLVDILGDPSQPEQPLPVPAEMLPRLAQQTNDQPHGIKWGEMTIETPPLPVQLPGRMKGRRKRVAEVRGRRLHRVGRLAVDGRVFATRPPLKGGGAVLIDTSGSMDLSPEQVLELCAAYPGGVIAAYSSNGDGVTGNDGTLRVIARNGRRVPDDQIDPPGGGNGVDGPALDWLAKQPGPRYWISDAGVSCGAEGLKYCVDLCRREQVTRVDDAWAIVGK